MAKQSETRHEQFDDTQLRIIQWLERHWTGDKKCPICGSDSWNVGDIAELRAFSGGTIVVPGRVYPVFPVVCNICGHVLLFNAMIAKLIEPPEPVAGDKTSAPRAGADDQEAAP